MGLHLPLGGENIAWVIEDGVYLKHWKMRAHDLLWN